MISCAGSPYADWLLFHGVWQLFDAVYPYSGYEFKITKNKEEVQKYIEGCQVYISFAPKGKYIEMGKNLRWAAALSAGVDYIPLNLIKSKNIILTNGSGIHKTHMAEYTISMMIAL